MLGGAGRDDRAARRALRRDGGAARSRFAISGVLARAPSTSGSASVVRPALLAARSLGAWADGIALSARVRRESVAIAAPSAIAGRGFSFADRNGFTAGDMLELAARNGSSVRYAKVVRTAAGTVWAVWIAGFAELASTGVRSGRARIAGDPRIYDATLEADGATMLTITEPVAVSPLVVGRWVKFEQQGVAHWLVIDRIDPRDRRTATGRAWRQVGSRMPQGDFAARRCTLEIAESDGDARRVAGGIGLAREHPAAIHAVLDDDLFYQPLESRAAASRAAFALTQAERTRLAAAMPRPAAASLFGSPGFTADDLTALRTGWLPLGLGAAFGEPARAIHSGAAALARDGLAVIDERLFLDPRLAPLTLTGLAQEAERLRDLADAQLFGLHAAIDIPSDLYSPASLIAVPDACQPAIVAATDHHHPPAPQPGAPSMARWATHRDGCLPPLADLPPAPDWSRFLDAETAVLATPRFVDPPTSSRDGDFALEWQSEAAGTVYVLEESGRFDFADAVEVLRARDATRFTATARAEGSWYYRLHLERDGNDSAYAACLVVVRTTGMVAAADSAAEAGARLRRVQVPMLRLCAATQDLFAILSLPRAFRAAEAADHARALSRLAPGFGAGDALGQAEGRALSYAALYHPWLETRQDRTLAATAPDGAIAGLYAARDTARGAWVAPANGLLDDIVGLDPALREADLAGLDAAQVNAIRRVPAGFTVLDADTLSPERDWRQIQVRRLMMLLRRSALRQGFTYVFEPNGAVLHRAIERSLATMLGDLEARGAFSAQAEPAWRVQVDAPGGVRDDGALTVELAVSPASALRTLTLRLTQVGNRLTIAEAA